MEMIGVIGACTAYVAAMNRLLPRLGDQPLPDHGTPTAAQLSAGAQRQAVPDLAEQLLSALRRHRDVPGEGAQ